MGTYTSNYNLFLPSIGEQGWGNLVNGNFTTIDTTTKGLDTRMGTAETNITSLTTRMGTAETTITSNKSRIGTLETTTNAMKEKLDTIEVVGGDIVGNITGKINLSASSLGSESKNILIATVTTTDDATLRPAYSNPYTYKLSAQGTVSRYNTSFINCVSSDDELRLVANGTCTVRVGHSTQSSSNYTCTVTVTDDSSGETVISSSQSIAPSSSKSWAFTRNYGTAYTIVVSTVYQTGTFAISTNSVNLYAG